MHRAFHFKMDECEGRLAEQVRLYKHLCDTQGQSDGLKFMERDSHRTGNRRGILSDGVEENEGSFHQSQKRVGTQVKTKQSR